MRKLAVLALALSACAADPGAQRRAFLASLIGQPEAAAVRALGVPSQTYQAGGSRFLSYTERGSRVIPGGPAGGYGTVSPEVVEIGCETTLEVAGGIVQSWSLRGTACG